MLGQKDMVCKLDSVLLKMLINWEFHLILPIQSAVEMVHDAIECDGSSFLLAVVKVSLDAKCVLTEKV